MIFDPITEKQHQFDGYDRFAAFNVFFHLSEPAPQLVMHLDVFQHFGVMDVSHQFLFMREMRNGVLRTVREKCF